MTVTAQPILERYEPVIGLEIHVQLETRSKLFCRCSTEFGAEPNRHTCPVCLGHPGVLPVVNAHAVHLAVRLALAAGSTVHTESVFARKNYFYPDLAKGYQISQYDRPLATGGSIRFAVANHPVRTVALTRMHLEEDAGKLIHDDAGDPPREPDDPPLEPGDPPREPRDASLVDFNRAGVPLVEVVSEPELRSPREAHAFLQTMRRLVRWLEVSDGNMEEGSLRCDANVSLRERGTTTLGTKTELKNLNSFRHVERALEFEITRHAEVLDSGARIEQETRLWDAGAGVTRTMRSKEDAHDYRYFPDPDLPPLRFEQRFVVLVRSALPELPEARAARYEREFGLPAYDADLLCGERGLADYFESTIARHDDPKRVSNWIMTEVMAVLNERQLAIEDLPVGPDAVAELLALVADGSLSSTLAKKVWAEMLAGGGRAGEVAETLGLRQIADETEITTHVQAVLDNNPEQLAQFLDGKESVIQFFMGQLMKRTRGQVHPGRAQELLRAALEGRRT